VAQMEAQESQKLMEVMGASPQQTQQVSEW
jgi:hypothetical protein